MNYHTCPKCKSSSIINNWEEKECILCGYKEDKPEEPIVIPIKRLREKNNEQRLGVRFR